MRGFGSSYANKMLRLDYRAFDRRAVLLWAVEDGQAAWVQPLRRLVVDHTPEARQENAQQLSLPWWGFSAMSAKFNTLLKGYGLRVGVHVDATPAARALLQQAQRSNAGYVQAQNAHRVDQGACFSISRRSNSAEPCLQSKSATSNFLRPCLLRQHFRFQVPARRLKPLRPFSIALAQMSACW